MDHITKKLSHIILIADKMVPKEPFLSFCTKAGSENPEIRFTYLCYDNLIPGNAKTVLCNLINSRTEEADSLFVITDSQEVLVCTADEDIASAALSTGYNKDADLSRSLYVIEDIEYMPYDRILKMWQRHHRIPWTIATTERLLIREQVPKDLTRLYEIYSDKEARRFTEPLYEDRDQEEDYLRKYIDNQYRFYEYGIWAVTLRDSGRLIGRAGISQREGYSLPELGYIIDRDYRGAGIAKEALGAIMSYGREELGMDEYMAFTKENNVSSVRLLKSLGFERCGQAHVMGSEHSMYVLTKA